MLTGSELLAKVKELGDASKSELVRECGYVSTKKDGSERLNFTAFYEALLEAKGLNLGDNSKGAGKGVVVVALHREREALTCGAACVEIQELRRSVTNLLCRLALGAF
jgi:hypothetical protein